MRKELIPLTIIGGLVAIEASRYAFSRQARQEIGERDGRWTCQGLDNKACHYGKDDGPVKYSDGYFLTAAHYKDMHGRDNDPDISRGRVLCQIHHSMEEIQRGNIVGARKLLNRGIYHWNHLKQKNISQIILTVDEIYEIMKIDGVKLGLGKIALEPYPDIQLLPVTAGK